MILPLKQVPFQKKAYTFKKSRILSKKGVYFQKKAYTFKIRRILSKKGVYFQNKAFSVTLSNKASHFKKMSSVLQSLRWHLQTAKQSTTPKFTDTASHRRHSLPWYWSRHRHRYWVTPPTRSGKQGFISNLYLRSTPRTPNVHSNPSR